MIDPTIPTIFFQRIPDFHGSSLASPFVLKERTRTMIPKIPRINPLAKGISPGPGWDKEPAPIRSDSIHIPEAMQIQKMVLIRSYLVNLFPYKGRHGSLLGFLSGLSYQFCLLVINLHSGWIYGYLVNLSCFFN